MINSANPFNGRANFRTEHMSRVLEQQPAAWTGVDMERDIRGTQLSELRTAGKRTDTILRERSRRNRPIDEKPHRARQVVLHCNASNCNNV